MQQNKIKVNLIGVPQTSLLALYGRAKISNECGLFFNDAKAVELVGRIDYDFSFFDLIAVDYVLFSAVARAMQLDKKLEIYIKKHPRASVVNLGAGFDTTFYRVDNGKIRWYDLDLPEVIEVRKQLIPETDRAICIAKSFQDPSWCQDIYTGDGVFIIAGGIFHYFDETEVRQLFLLLADQIPGCEIAFDAESKSSIDIDGNCGAFGAGWSDDSPEKRDAMQAEYMRTSENAWKMLLSKELLYKIISSLTTPTKPESTEWSDFENWWNQLNVQEKGKAMSDLSAGSPAFCKSPLEDANELTTWDKRITVVDQFPLYRDIQRDPSLSLSIRQFMDYTDEKGRIKIFHIII